MEMETRDNPSAESTAQDTNATSAARPPVLLATKVIAPRIPKGLIDRPRLADLANEAADKRLSVIKAPAGFGKTSLALAWFSRLAASGTLLAWLSLDAEDDEPARFLHHLSHSLRYACGNVGASAIGLTAEASLVPANSVMATLINELVDVDDEICLFIDDYHLISLPTIHDAMSFFIANAPSHVHLVICSRTEPPLHLGRLRAHNELLEIDASMLRFNVEETRGLVESTCPAKLPAADVKSLCESTEGWAAALRISTSALARNAHQRAWEVVPATGTSRPLATYLEEILHGLPDETVDFMMCTAILDRLTAPLCDAVTGTANGHSMLTSIASRQMLLEPIDSEGYWFRYHHLMAEYLCQRLAAQPRFDVKDLHRRACQWYAEQALWTEAVKHAIAAGLTSEAIRLMEQCAMALVKKGDLLTLLGWQRQFPADLMRAQVVVTLAIAWGMALAMRFDEALTMLNAIERDVMVDGNADRDEIHWKCLVIRSTVIALQDEPERALAIAQGCLNRPSTDSWTSNVASNVVRFGQWKMGNLDALYSTPWIPYSVEEDQRNVFSSVYRLCILGFAEMEQLHFGLAERHLNESARLAARHAGPRSILNALYAPMLAKIHYEQSRLDEAEALLVDLMPVIDLAVFLDSALTAYITQVRIARTRSDTLHAYALLDQAEALGHNRRWNRLIAATLLERTRLLLSEGRLAEASACATRLEQLAFACASTISRQCLREIQDYRTLGAAYVSLSRRDAQSAVESLQATLRDSPTRRSDFISLNLKAVLALALLATRQRARAVRTFHDVVRVAAPAGIYRTILDQGSEIGELLQATREDIRGTEESGGTATYLDSLIIGWREIYRSEDKPRRDAETLSAREQAIVKLIAQGQSNKEIARTLGIAPGTVKTHVKSIFTKLSVDKRAHAVFRAQELGIVRH
ncbi:LuxR C-terminal-related transcriptional regulator [Paraburkholderia denitrificans]